MTIHPTPWGWGDSATIPFPIQGRTAPEARTVSSIDQSPHQPHVQLHPLPRVMQSRHTFRLMTSLTCLYCAVLPGHRSASQRWHFPQGARWQVSDDNTKGCARPVNNTVASQRVWPGQDVPSAPAAAASPGSAAHAATTAGNLRGRRDDIMCPSWWLRSSRGLWC